MGVEIGGRETRPPSRQIRGAVPDCEIVIFQCPFIHLFKFLNFAKSEEK